MPATEIQAKPEQKESKGECRCMKKGIAGGKIKVRGLVIFISR
jgi:hypothetical protein